MIEKIPVMCYGKSRADFHPGLFYDSIYLSYQSENSCFYFKTTSGGFQELPDKTKREETMAEKDVTEKILMSYADVFADCINALAYGGRQRLRPENTKPAPTESFYRTPKPHNQFCDASRYLVGPCGIIAQYIIENETQPRERQILRNISYQGGAYRQQLESSAPVYAVIGIVLAWTGKASRIPQSLHALLAQNGVPPEELRLVDDIHMTIYRMNSLSPEIRKRFVSDMGFVVDYLNEGSFDGRRGQRIVHLEALCDMMEAITGDGRFREQAEKLLEKQPQEDIIMCEYIDLLEARGEARGKALGEASGEAKLTLLLETLYDQGRDDEAKLAVRDMDVRAELYRELRIPNYTYEAQT